MQCGALLPCGHRCPRMCHPDNPNHRAVICEQLVTMRAPLRPRLLLRPAEQENTRDSQPRLPSTSALGHGLTRALGWNRGICGLSSHSVCLLKHHAQSSIFMHNMRWDKASACLQYGTARGSCSR